MGDHTTPKMPGTGGRQDKYRFRATHSYRASPVLAYADKVVQLNYVTAFVSLSTIVPYSGLISRGENFKVFVDFALSSKF